MKLILDCSTAPEQFLEGVIIYMHKKGDPKDTNNYRGITLLSVVGKLTNKVIANRLIGAVEEHELLHEAQNAFRPGRSTDDHIFITLSQLVRGRKNRNQRTYAFFLDLQKAYDIVWRDYMKGASIPARVIPPYLSSSLTSPSKKSTTTIGGCLRERSSSVACHYLYLYLLYQQ